MKKLLPFVIGLVLAGGAGAGGYFASSTGMLAVPMLGSPANAKATDDPALGEETLPAFVEIEPMVVSLGGELSGRQLRFVAQLEVPAEEVEAVRHLKPRVVDVLNGYLRAVEIGDLQQPAALLILRDQMLRRVQVATGPGKVDDLLVMEFIVN